MKKPHVRLYPIDIARLPWERPPGAREGISQKYLAHDQESGSHTRLLRVDPRADTGIFVHDFCEEVYLLEGSYRAGEEFHPTGTYTCKPPDIKHGPFLTEDGYLGLEFRDYHGPRMNKPLVRLYPIDIARLPWERPAGAPEGVWQKMLALDPDGGSHTRLVRVEPGVDTRDVLVHDFWEEIYILQGSCKAGDEFHPAGTYTCRPPGVRHGPFLTDEGYLCIEVRNYET